MLIRIAYCLLILFSFSCVVVKDVKTGREAFEKKQYHRAIDMLTKEFASEKNTELRAETAYLIAKSYDFKNDYSSSVSWYETSLDLFDRPQTILSLAQAYKRIGNYDAAIKAFTALYNETDDKERFRKEINILKQVKNWKLSDQDYEFETASLIANSPYSEYGVSIDGDGNLTFVSDRPSDINDETYNWTGNGFTDIYTANPKGGFVELYDSSLNTEGHEGPLCFSEDFTEVYFTRCNAIELRDEHCRLYYAYFENDRWTEPLPMAFFTEQINYGNPALMDNDSVLVFSARSLGKDHELFYAIREDYGWSEPFQMPDYINSAGDDMFPTVDGDTLFFASDGHPGLGGLDVFKVVLNKDRSFSRPENLQLPINSSYDDFHYVVTARDENSYTGYVSTSRGLVGGDDIMSFVATRKAPVEVETPIDTLTAEEEPTLYLAVRIKGKTETGEEVSLNQPKVDIRLNNTEQKVNPSKGVFILEVKENDIISFDVSDDQYLFKSKSFDISDDVPTDLNKTSYTINKTIVLDPIILDKEITLENIYYDFEKWDIRADARPSLDELSTLMRQNPSIKIQLASHTDCRGDNAFNQELSQKRAQSAVDYIIASGISSSRMTAKGFGENQPAIDCLCASCSEDEHQTNRRTTFSITSK